MWFKLTRNIIENIATVIALDIDCIQSSSGHHCLEAFVETLRCYVGIAFKQNSLIREARLRFISVDTRLMLMAEQWKSAGQ